jgi:thiol-disulfide isomerase/thioredoxin
MLALPSCDEGVKRTAMASAPRERSEVVAASASTASAATEPSAHAAPSPMRAPGQLCAGQLAKPGRDLPKKPLARKSAQGARTLPAAISPGHWTWINLWAAWCAPCKEELPRLVRFAGRTAQLGHPLELLLLSLDDDERQLEQFLAQQPSDATRSTYWLREGRERDDWLLATGLPRDPGLPMQVLVDPRGKVRCVVNGAIEDGDFAELASLGSLP